MSVPVSHTANPPGALASLRARLGNPSWMDLALPVIFLVLLAIAAVASDTFLTQGNLTNLLRQIVINGLLSLGMLVVILSGGIDLSVGAVLALSAILVGTFSDAMPMPLAILLAIGAAALVGLINGGIIARFSIASFIVTLGALSARAGPRLRHL